MLGGACLTLKGQGRAWGRGYTIQCSSIVGALERSYYLGPYSLSMLGKNNQFPIFFCFYTGIFFFRKRLRSVCAEELPWRSQANLIQATCHLDMLLGRLGVAEATIESEPHPQQPHGLTFDAAGVIIDRVLPLYSPVVAGAGDKKVNTSVHIS